MRTAEDIAYDWLTGTRNKADLIDLIKAAQREAAKEMREAAEHEADYVMHQRTLGGQAQFKSPGRAIRALPLPGDNPTCALPSKSSLRTSSLMTRDETFRL